MTELSPVAELLSDWSPGTDDALSLLTTAVVSVADVNMAVVVEGSVAWMVVLAAVVGTPVCIEVVGAVVAIVVDISESSRI